MKGSRRVAVISPHLDDGVFSCGDLLASRSGPVVISVMAGVPEEPVPPTPWDAAAGFAGAADAMLTRRREDETALRLLGAEPVWLPFLDAQYGCSTGVDEIAASLRVAVLETGAATVLAPLGLFHSDHKLTHEAALLLADGQPGLDVWLYEDAIYRGITGLVSERLGALRKAGYRLSQVAPACLSVAKREAVTCYVSQLRALSAPPARGYEDVFQPERYWRLQARRVPPK